MWIVSICQHQQRTRMNIVDDGRKNETLWQSECLAARRGYKNKRIVRPKRSPLRNPVPVFSTGKRSLGTLLPQQGKRKRKKNKEAHLSRACRGSEEKGQVVRSYDFRQENPISSTADKQAKKKKMIEQSAWTDSPSFSFVRMLRHRWWLWSWSCCCYNNATIFPRNVFRLQRTRESGDDCRISVFPWAGDTQPSVSPWRCRV